MSQIQKRFCLCALKNVDFHTYVRLNVFFFLLMLSCGMQCLFIIYMMYTACVGVCLVKSIAL